MSAESGTRANLKHGSTVKDDLGDIYAVVDRIRESSASEIKTLDELRTKFDQILLTFTGFKSDAQLTYKDIEANVKGTSTAVDGGFRETRRLLETISGTVATNADTLARFERVLQATLATLYELRDAASTSHEMHKGFKTMFEQLQTAVELVPELAAAKMPMCGLRERDGVLRTTMEATHAQFAVTAPRLEKVLTELLKEYGYDAETGKKREGFFIFWSKAQKAIINNLLSLLATAIVLMGAKYIASSSIEEAKKAVEQTYKQRTDEQDEKLKRLEQENKALQDLVRSKK